LASSSVVNLDNTLLLPRGRLVRRLGAVGAADLVRLCAALAVAVGCPP
jgi:mRNA-degrading endonuclease toxin of MazEF toxin-antitoxin module